jgi:uncharacterized membrane protein
MTIVLILIYVIAPAGIVYLSGRIKGLRFLNPVILCYLLGILLGNIGIIPEAAAGAQDLLSSIAVALSIPLMLFTINLRSWGKLTGRAGIGMILAAVSIVIVSSLGFLIFRNSVDEGWKLSGLLVGVYTGGTPNLAAIRLALDVDNSIYLAAHTADMIFSGIYLVFVLSFAKPLLSKILKPYVPVSSTVGDVADASQMEFKELLKKENIRQLALVFISAIVIVGAALGISQLFPIALETIIVILSITTLGLLASLIKPIREIQLSFKLGEYIILIFCVVVGSLADVGKLIESSTSVILYVCFALFGSFVLHVLLCKIFRVDADTMIVTSTSAICSPPFVGMVSISIKNREIIGAGIATGIIGYAVGNYIGVFVSMLLKNLA